MMTIVHQQNEGSENYHKSLFKLSFSFKASMSTEKKVLIIEITNEAMKEKKISPIVPYLPPPSLPHSPIL